MLTSLSLTNFKIHRELHIALSPITVLVGPNGCGKSTILEALWCLSALASGLPPASLFRGHLAPSEVRSSDAQGNAAIQAAGVLAGSTFSSEWRSESPIDPGTYLLASTDGTPTPITDLTKLLTPYERLARAVGATWLRLDPRVLAAPDHSDDEHPTITDRGAGIATFLAYLKLHEDERFDELTDVLRQVVPGVRNVRFDRVKELAPSEPDPYRPDGRSPEREVINTRILFDTDQGRGIPAHRVSEGTLVVLGLLATLFNPAAPRRLLIEEPERALHPRAFATLANHLRRLQGARPDTQLILATHSPDLVSEFDPSQVRLMSFDEDRRPTCVAMDQHPEFAAWRDLMLPGEFWLTVDRPQPQATQ
jgi:hypothetical protein